MGGGPENRANNFHVEGKAMTTHPDTTSSPDAGLTQVGGIWYALYTVEGKRRRKSLEVTSINLARLARDRFYASIGAIPAKRGRPPLPDGIILQVRVEGKTVSKGRFSTMKEAKEAYGSR